MGFIRKVLKVATNVVKVATIPVRTVAHAVVPNKVAGTILNKSISRINNPTVTRESAPINLGSAQRPILTNVKTAIDQRRQEDGRIKTINDSIRRDVPLVQRSPIDSFTDLVLDPPFQPEAPNTLMPDPSFIDSGLANLNTSQQSSDIQNPNKMMEKIKALPTWALYGGGALLALLAYMFFKRRRR